MKTPFLLRAVLFCATSTFGCAVPALAVPALPSTFQLPAEVRAMMAAGGKTVAFVPLNLGMKNTSALLHCWTIARSSQQTASGEYAPSLYCLDLFLRDPDNQNKWELSSSTSYQGGGQIYDYETRWLDPAKKQGLVIVERSEESTDVLYRLITFPDWQGSTPADLDTTNAHVQNFYASFGGPISSSVYFGLSKKGKMTVVAEVAPHVRVLPTRNIYGWNGDSWRVISSRKIKAQERRSNSS